MPSQVACSPNASEPLHCCRMGVRSPTAQGAGKGMACRFPCMLRTLPLRAGPGAGGRANVHHRSPNGKGAIKRYEGAQRPPWALTECVPVCICKAREVWVSPGIYTARPLRQTVVRPGRSLSPFDNSYTTPLYGGDCARVEAPVGRGCVALPRLSGLKQSGKPGRGAGPAGFGAPPPVAPPSGLLGAGPATGDCASAPRGLRSRPPSAGRSLQSGDAAPWSPGCLAAGSAWAAPARRWPAGSSRSSR